MMTSGTSNRLLACGALRTVYSDFPKPPSVYVENKASHWHFFGDPRMRPHLFDLFLRVLDRILVRKETHGGWRCISRQFRELRVQFRVGKGVNPQPVWLRSMISFDPKTRVETTSSASTSSVTAGPPLRTTSMSARFRPCILSRSESRGSMQVTTAMADCGCAPSLGS
jgi:hypothetical protein